MSGAVLAYSLPWTKNHDDAGVFALHYGLKHGPMVKKHTKITEALTF